VIKLVKRFFRKKLEQSWHPIRVEALIVEDQQDESDFLAGLLRANSVLVTQAKNIAGALECLNQPVIFQLAFVDLKLPNGSGIEVIRRIKETKRLTHVIVTSGAIEQVPLVMSYGYVGLMGKPFSSSTVSEILYKHRLPGSF